MQSCLPPNYFYVIVFLGRGKRDKAKVDYSIFDKNVDYKNDDKFEACASSFIIFNLLNYNSFCYIYIQTYEKKNTVKIK